MSDFVPFPKIPRLSRDMIITEKLDGTNASITITHLNDFGRDPREAGATALVGDYALFAGSRKKFIQPAALSGNKSSDNFGFAAWVYEHREELLALGPGTHYGEWWGKGIQRGYGLDEKRFSLFNVGRWIDPRTFPGDPVYGSEMAPSCCHVVPVLYTGTFSTHDIAAFLEDLKMAGSLAAPGFMAPEGIMIYHTAANQYFKKTFEGDAMGKETLIQLHPSLL